MRLSASATEQLGLHAIIACFASMLGALLNGATLLDMLEMLWMLECMETGMM